MHKIIKSKLLLPLVVASLCLNMFGLTCSEGIVEASNSVTPYVEYLKFCGTIKPIRGNFKITKAELLLGKWIDDPDNVTEIGPPVNQTNYEGGELRFCTAGQAFTPSGTAGYVVVFENTPNATIPDQPTRITWNVPFIGSFQQKIRYSVETYNITTYKVSERNYYDYVYTIKKL